MHKGLSGEVKVFAFGKVATVIDFHHYGLTIDRIGYSKGSTKGVSAVSGSELVITKDFSTGCLRPLNLSW